LLDRVRGTPGVYTTTDPTTGVYPRGGVGVWVDRETQSRGGGNWECFED